LKKLAEKGKEEKWPAKNQKSPPYPRDRRRKIKKEEKK